MRLAIGLILGQTNFYNAKNVLPSDPRFINSALKTSVEEQFRYCPMFS